MPNQTLKAHLRALLTQPQAHIMFDDVLRDFPLDEINNPLGGPHTPWQLLWHLWYAQRDLLHYMSAATYQPSEWPAGYWPKVAGSAEQWQEVAASWRKDLDHILTVLDGADLLQAVPNATSPEHTYLRELLLVADHNAYHLGQLELLKKMFLGQ